MRARAFALVQECRDAGFTTEMDHQKRSLKSQFKLADKLGAARVAVLGPDELDAGEVTLRDMAAHTEARCAWKKSSASWVARFCRNFLALLSGVKEGAVDAAMRRQLFLFLRV